MPTPLDLGEVWALWRPFLAKRHQGNIRDGNISLWEISYFRCVRNFLLNSQATVRNKVVSKFSHLGASPPHRRFFNSSMIRNAWPCPSQRGGTVLAPKGATTSAPALGTQWPFLHQAHCHCPADLEAETGAPSPLVLPHPLSFPRGGWGTVTCSTQKCLLQLTVLLWQNHHPRVLPKAFQWKVVSMCKSSRSSGAGPRKFAPRQSRSRSPYIGSPLNVSYAEFFRFMLQFLCLQMCVYGGSAVPEGGLGDRHLVTVPQGGLGDHHLVTVPQGAVGDRHLVTVPQGVVGDRLPWAGEGQRGGRNGCHR